MLTFRWPAKFGNTTFPPVLCSRPTDSQTNSLNESLTSTNDPTYKSFTGDALDYLMVSKQSPAFDNGNLTWDNIASFGGDWISSTRVDEFGTLEADTQWNSWFSTQVAVAYSNDNILNAGNGETVNFYSPGATTNPLPGNWTVGGGAPEGAIEPNRNKAGRIAFLMTNEWLGGRANSHTVFGADNIGSHFAKFNYSYYQADSNWNVLTPSVSSNSNPGGRGVLNARSGVGGEQRADSLSLFQAGCSAGGVQWR